MFSLGAVLLAIFALAWLARRVPGLRAAGGLLQVRGGVQVGPRERVVLLQAGDQWLLIGVASGSVRTLQVLDRVPAEWNTAAPAAVSPKFAKTLAQLLHKTPPQ